jgi:uncharacterized Zn-finger protein
MLIALERHMCSVCNKSFQQKSILTSHMLVHTGKKVGKLSSKVKNNQNIPLCLHRGEESFACDIM